MQSLVSEQIYTTSASKASRHGEIFRASGLVREAALLLRRKAANLPHSVPSARLQRIASSFGLFGDSLERVAVAIERGHHRKLPGASESEGELDLLATSIRRAPIGSKIARDLRARRAVLREQTAAGLGVEEEPSVAHRGMALEQTAEGVA